MGLLWPGGRPPARCAVAVWRRLPPRPAVIPGREPARPAYALPNCVPSASWSSSLPVPLGLARNEHEDPRAFRHIGTRPPGRWGNARRSTAPAPQSKPVIPASRLVAHVAPLVASGLGLRILAAGPAVDRLYSYRGRLHESEPNSLLGLVPGRRDQLTRCQRPGSSPRSVPPRIIERDRHDETACRRD